jgi:glycosyltransferase involved in cell wall biosynthesis
MSISIVIPTRNERRNIERLLTSIAADPHPPREVVIVDNHSTDKTRTVARRTWNQHLPKKLKSYQIKPKKLIILTKGPERSAQRNVGAKNARGTHLLFLDADMELTPGLLAELQNLVIKRKNAAIIPEYALGHDFWGKAVALERSCYQGEPLLKAPRFIEKKIFLTIGGYNETLVAGEDWDLDERIQKQGVEIVHTTNPLLHHEVRGFLPNLKRKWYYTEHIGRYAAAHPRRFARLSGMSRLKIYGKNRDVLIRHPLLTVAFMVLKVVIYLKWQLTLHIRE